MLILIKIHFSMLITFDTFSGKDDQMLDNIGWESNSVTQTDVEDDPWWEVDLEEDFVIKKLIIFKRLGEYGDDLSNLEVVIRNSSNKEVSKQAIDRNDETSPSIEINLDNVTGQSVRLNLKGKNRVLCLAEVKVYGEYYDFDLPIGEIFRYVKCLLTFSLFLPLIFSFLFF